MNLLFCGDIVGRAGRKIVTENLARIKVENKIIALDGEKSAVVASTIKQGGGEPCVSSLAKITFYRPEKPAPVLAS